MRHIIIAVKSCSYALVDGDNLWYSFEMVFILELDEVLEAYAFILQQCFRSLIYTYRLFLYTYIVVSYIVLGIYLKMNAQIWL